MAKKTQANKTEHHKTGLEDTVGAEQKKHKPGELGARDPSGKMWGLLQGQQEGFDVGGFGDGMNLEQQNRNNR